MSAATNDSHFMVLVFTAASGEPVMCTVVLEGMELKPEWVTGINIFAKQVELETDDNFSHTTQARATNLQWELPVFIRTKRFLIV